MRLHLFEYTCARCARSFKAPELVGGYGDLLLRSTGLGTESVVFALSDEAFGEVGRLLDVVGGAEIGSYRQGELVQEIFGITCDPDIDGSRFVVGGKPRCPTCGSHLMQGWRATEPPEIVDIDIPHVSHEKWMKKSLAERIELVRLAFEAAQRSDGG